MHHILIRAYLRNANQDNLQTIPIFILGGLLDTTERYDLEEAFGKFGRVKNSWVARYTSSSKMFAPSHLARHKLVVVVPSLSSASLYLTTTQLDFTLQNARQL